MAAPLPNPPEMLLTANPPASNFAMQEQYPPIEQHGGSHYGISDVIQYGGAQYQAPGYLPAPTNYASQPPAYQYNTSYPDPNAYPDSYVLTQLTEPSKPNYPIQTYPIHDQAYNQPAFSRMYSEEQVKEPEPMDKIPPQSDPHSK